jgi:hypothetical protein
MNSLLPADREHLAKLLGMLGSDHLGERDNTARAAHRLVQQRGMTWFDVVTPTPPVTDHDADPVGPVSADWRRSVAACSGLPAPYQSVGSRLPDRASAISDPVCQAAYGPPEDRCPSPGLRVRAMSTPAEVMVAVTFFPDFAAQTKREEALRLHNLAKRIATTTATSKATLPWLKLGTFGDHTTDANCLRHNANVLTITGVEADYDGEIISFVRHTRHC